jgi:hypothetical protein
MFGEPCLPCSDFGAMGFHSTKCIRFPVVDSKRTDLNAGESHHATTKRAGQGDFATASQPIEEETAEKQTA